MTAAAAAAAARAKGKRKSFTPVMVVIAHWLLVITRYYGISVGKWGSAVLRDAMERNRNVRLCSRGWQVTSDWIVKSKLCAEW